MSLISVVLPFKNAETTLQASIESVLNQSYKNIELVLIDDNSEDNSRSIVEACADSRIKLIQNNDSGIASALNLGIQHSSGRYIARMDADDISYPNRLLRQLEAFYNKPETTIMSCKVNHKTLAEENLDARGYAHYVEWTNTILSAEQHFNNRFVDAPIAHPTLFCSKSIFEKYGYYKADDCPEDFELWLRWMSQGVEIQKVDEVLLDWYDHGTRLSRVHPNYSTKKFYSIKAEYFALWWNQQQKKPLWVWGYGKDVFARSSHLKEQNIEIKGYVDIVERPNSQRQVKHYSVIKNTGNDFYLVYLSNREGKQRIVDFFKQRKMMPGKDYLFMA